jgi:hypothetical protein
VAVCDHAGDEWIVEDIDSINCVSIEVRWQKDLAADSILRKVACLSKLMVEGRMKRSPSNSMVLEASVSMREWAEVVQRDSSEPITI